MIRSISLLWQSRSQLAGLESDNGEEPDFDEIASTNAAFARFLRLPDIRLERRIRHRVDHITIVTQTSPWVVSIIRGSLDRDL
jgi:hypothetical protein